MDREYEDDYPDWQDPQSFLHRGALPPAWHGRPGWPHEPWAAAYFQGLAAHGFFCLSAVQGHPLLGTSLPIDEVD